MIFFQICFQRVRIQGTTVIRGIEYRVSAIYFYKISKSLAEYSVIQDKNPVARLCQGSAGSFQPEDSFSAQDQAAVPGGGGGGGVVGFL